MILNESLDDIYSKYYQYGPNHLDRDEFDDVIKIDPTFKLSQDKLGNYGQWLLRTYKNNGNHFTDDEIEELNAQLNIFNTHKRGYEPADRDINRCKSLADLIAVNDKYDAKNSSEQSLKAAQFPGLELVGQSAKWEVYRPETYEASKHIRSDNAVWCTGRANDDHYFKNYNERAYLLVFINKQNRDDKYQAAISKNTYQCTEFRDHDNNSQDFALFVQSNPDIKEILEKSKYKEAVVVIEDELKAKQTLINNTNHVISLIKNNVLKFDKDLIDFINTVTPATIDFNKIFKNVKIIAIDDSFTTIPDELINAVRNSGSRYGTDRIDWNEKEIYLPENIASITNIFDFIMQFGKIHISKKSHFKCLKTQFTLLRDSGKIVWED